ncbi:lactococcin 972 family bacteriocin [Curtobacterium sp. P97]|uniref:lactococcin 972 family bacteriocin n=1 Tax=Curtobacterium sp. P97 TaxID=2939562 RepID=UPI00203CE497|nr:lactococcin 972 family bacteriocin [Curtobacterium sp. P97]MCM3520984.1 lactococcin 972 family bacteriocin [Curtobacterium sp. P97]
MDHRATQNTGKQVLLGLAVTIGLVLGGTATAAVASPTEVLGHGPEAGGVVLPDSGIGTTGEHRTSGQQRSDGGGGSFWQWGVSGGDVWSNYFREKRCHGATAVGKKTKRVTGVAGGRYAYAATPKKPSGNQAYYHNC